MGRGNPFIARQTHFVSAHSYTAACTKPWWYICFILWVVRLVARTRRCIAVTFELCCFSIRSSSNIADDCTSHHGESVAIWSALQTCTLVISVSLSISTGTILVLY